jgi:23S rRNA pseudouridine1911/1915/1917 synthase
MADWNMIDVIFEDNHLLVLNKPPLIATMGAQPGSPSLAEQTKKYLKRKYNKPGNVYVGVVSRLDAFVSGAIVLAKTSKAAGRLSDQFRRRLVGKFYYAIVPGGVLSNQGVIENWIYKDDANHRMRCTENGNHAGAKRGRLTYTMLGRDQKSGFQWIKVNLETGRKHQIRVQLSHAGVPIVGDKKYDSPHGFSAGIALHCYQLSFEHPTLKKTMKFQVDPPQNWRLARYVL